MSCDQFEAGSRKRQICEGTSGLDLAKTNAYRTHWGLSELSELPEVEVVDTIIHQSIKGPNSPVIVPKRNTRSKCGCGTKQLPYGPGTELKNMYVKAGIPACQQCNKLSKEMNKLGVEGCRTPENFEMIVNDIFPRAKKWVADNKPWIHNLLPNIVEDAAIKLKIEIDVRKAIALAEEKLKKKVK